MVFRAALRDRGSVRSMRRSRTAMSTAHYITRTGTVNSFFSCHDADPTMASWRHRWPAAYDINQLRAVHLVSSLSPQCGPRPRQRSGKAPRSIPLFATSTLSSGPRAGHSREQHDQHQSPRPSPRDTTVPGISDHSNPTPDIDRNNIVLRMLGPRWSAYGRLARIDKPAGALLLTYPCWWGAALATPMGSFPDPLLLAVFATSAFVMRSAGCTINDMWDRDLDRKVTRTKSRPLASGELNTAQAVVFLGAQLGLGLCGLLTLNVECVKLGFAAMPLVIVYPLMKRYTDWPQAVLGLTFNWGAIVGWTAVHGSVSWPHVLPLYAAGVCWTLVYDTLYGHQDKKDDKRLGIRSTALLFGENTKSILAGFGAASVGLIGVAGYTTGLSWQFYVGTAMAAGYLAKQIGSANLDDPEGLLRIFRSNHEFGALVFASIVAGHWHP